MLNRITKTLKDVYQLPLRWVDNQATPLHVGPNKIDWARIVPFIGIHLACLAVFFVGFSGFALGLALFLYGLRVFAITGFYHRYFSHKTFKTNRFWQFIFAVLGLTAIQRGPLWWAAHHRDHHLVSDQEEDPHSPVKHGFLWSHFGWFLSKKYFHHNPSRIQDFNRFAELRFLDRFDVIVPVLFGVGLYTLGEYLKVHAPQLHTNGLQLFIWGFCVSTVCVFHATFTINSLSHCFGSRPHQTKDNSRNNLFLALLSFGEGWHNNHHFYPASVRQGFKWWQIDITYYLLLGLSKLRIISDLRQPPAQYLA